MVSVSQTAVTGAKAEKWRWQSEKTRSHQEPERIHGGSRRPDKHTYSLRICVWLIKAPERVLLPTHLHLWDAQSTSLSAQTSSVRNTGHPRLQHHHRLFSTQQVDASRLHHPASRNSAWVVSCTQAGTGGSSRVGTEVVCCSVSKL